VSRVSVLQQVGWSVRQPRVPLREDSVSPWFLDLWIRIRRGSEPPRSCEAAGDRSLWAACGGDPMPELPPIVTKPYDSRNDSCRACRTFPDFPRCWECVASPASYCKWLI